MGSPSLPASHKAALMSRVAAPMVVPLIGVPEGMHSKGLDISADRTQVRFPSGEAAQALLSTCLPPDTTTTVSVSFEGFDSAIADVRLGLLPCGSKNWSDPFVGFGC